MENNRKKKRTEKETKDGRDYEREKEKEIQRE